MCLLRNFDGRLRTPVIQQRVKGTLHWVLPGGHGSIRRRRYSACLTADESAKIWKRTFAIGLQVTIENTSGIIAPFLYPATDGPRYVKGHSITLALVGFAAVVYALMSWWLRRENRAHVLLERNDLNEGNLVQGIDNICDRNPRFLYTC